eukprot:2879581-Rhodomonas_salina.2
MPRLTELAYDSAACGTDTAHGVRCSRGAVTQCEKMSRAVTDRARGCRLQAPLIWQKMALFYADTLCLAMVHDDNHAVRARFGVQ